jgi:hypothetical protein
MMITPGMLISFVVIYYNKDAAKTRVASLKGIVKLLLLLPDL